MRSKHKLKKRFLDKLELFYRNFGNEWTVDDFVTNQNQKEYLFNILQELEEKNIIYFKEDKKTFIIQDLPSNHPNLY